MTSAAVADGLFEIADTGPVLIGSRCASCDTVYFPEAISCRNPDCRGKAIARTLLPSRGRLVSYTVQRYRPPPLFRMDDWEPYAIGLVDLGEGLEVMAMLTGMALDLIKIGAPLVLVIEPLFVDDVRGPVTTFKFAPADA